MQRHIDFFLNRLTVASVAVVLLFNLVEYLWIPDQSDWVFLFLIQPSYIAVAALPLALRLFWRATDLIGHPCTPPSPHRAVCPCALLRRSEVSSGVEVRVGWGGGGLLCFLSFSFLCYFLFPFFCPPPPPGTF